MIKHWSTKKIFDRTKLPRLFGMQFAGMAIALSLITYPTHAFDYQIGEENLEALTKVVTTTTASAYSFPLEMTLGMSQGYHGLHPGVDLRAPVGTKIFSIADGVVIEVEKMVVGYGHFVRIAHDGTLSSLYAHLHNVEVKPGDKVMRGETIGTVGMTGWTTGPHLHLELHVGEKSVNPLSYIGAKTK